MGIATAEVLSVGTELLIGDIVNTDAAFISKGLAALGISQYRQGVVGDNADRLREAVKESLLRSDLLILTGGLGPTYDDITKEIACEAMGRKLVLNEDSLTRIKGFFEKRQKTMTENNVKQAYLPENCDIFPNKNGTADGCAVWNDEQTKLVIMLPGPPRELEPMFENQVMPYLAKFTDRVLVSRNVNICGMGEAEVEMILRERMKKAVNPTEAPYCQEGEVRIRVTASADTAENADELCKRDIEELYNTEIGKYIYGVDTTLEETVIKELTKQNITLFTAESCTGGLVCKKLTDVHGASAVLRGGIVSYVNDIKKGLLGVSDDTIKEYTEVSCECAAEMANGARKISGADIAVSATGYASDGNGVPDGKAGLVFIGLSDKFDTEVRELHFTGSRSMVRERAVKEIFRMILDYVKTLKGENNGKAEC